MSTSGLTKHLNAHNSHFYSKSQPPHELLEYKSHNKENALGGN